MRTRIALAGVVTSGLLLLAAPAAGAIVMPPWPPPPPNPPFAPITGSTAAAPSAAPATAPVTPAASAPASAAAPVNSVAGLQQRLKALAYDPGPVDGKFGPMTRYAVIAFQKVQGMKVTGVADSGVYAALSSPKAPPVLAPNAGGDRIEIDLGRQLLMAYQGGALKLISHISSGSGQHYCEKGQCGTAITPRGTFHILYSRSGWDKSPLGLLYNPEYFTTAGHAIHGSPSVPLYPASHGCVRIPMHTSQWFPSIVARGEVVVVQ